MRHEVKTYGPISSGAAVGGDGVATATGTTTTNVNGIIYAVYVQYLGSPPAGTTDVTIATQGSASGAPPAQTIIAISNAATDGYFYPRVQIHNTAAAAQSFYDRAIVNDKVTVTIAQANAADYVNVWLLLV